MGKNYKETLNEQIQNPEFKAEWEALEPKRQTMRAIIERCDEQADNREIKS